VKVCTGKLANSFQIHIFHSNSLKKLKAVNWVTLTKTPERPYVFHATMKVTATFTSLLILLGKEFYQRKLKYSFKDNAKNHPCVTSRLP